MCEETQRIVRIGASIENGESATVCKRENDSMFSSSNTRLRSVIKSSGHYERGKDRFNPRQTPLLHNMSHKYCCDHVSRKKKGSGLEQLREGGCCWRVSGSFSLGSCPNGDTDSPTESPFLHIFSSFCRSSPSFSTALLFSFFFLFLVWLFFNDGHIGVDRTKPSRSNRWRLARWSIVARD